VVRRVLLDVDGTLVVSNDAHAQAWSTAFAEYGIDAPPARFRDLIGMGGDRIVPTIAAELSAQRGLGKTIGDRRKTIFLQDHAPKLVPTPGATAFVERLRADGLRPVVATSAQRDELDALLHIAGVSQLIDLITTADDVRESKPAPDIVTAALQKANIAADAAILIGDTPYDIEAALRAGVAAIAVRCGGWNDRALTGALAIYDNPADLLARYDSSILAPVSTA